MRLIVHSHAHVSPGQLETLFTQVPPDAGGFDMSVKHLHLHTQKPERIQLQHSLEGRFFWPDGELRWHSHDAFNGEAREQRFQVVLVGNTIAYHDLTQAGELQPSHGETRLMLWEKRLTDDGSAHHLLGPQSSAEHAETMRVRVAHHRIQGSGNLVSRWLNFE